MLRIYRFHIYSIYFYIGQTISSSISRCFPFRIHLNSTLLASSEHIKVLMLSIVVERLINIYQKYSVIYYNDEYHQCNKFRLLYALQ